ncbi:class I SAM-dependent methyltransferase [Mycobacterium sp. MBM]|nr:class I SAM-dependent methyltransferase [Mycobacterium sp. MBM]
MTVTAIRPAELDPLCPMPDGVWRSPGVRVRRRSGHHHGHALCASRFCADRRDGVLLVEHDLGPDELSDALTLMLTDQLDGILLGQHDFESVFTGVVRTTVVGGLASWSRFYRNSLQLLESGRSPFSAVHRRAAELVTGLTLLDLGSCFGFFPLRMSRLGHQVTATDLSTPTMDLLARVSVGIGRPLRTVACDAARVPRPDRVADTVTALHLFEHLDPDTGDAVLAEAVRLARRRVVVAVPFEQVPQACYGHVRTFDLATLRELGTRCPEMRAGVFEHHGGWLVLDRV